jgi:hypothetical protein
MLTADAKKYGLHSSQRKEGDKEIDRIERGKIVYYKDGTKQILNDNEGMMEKEAKPSLSTVDNKDGKTVEADLEDLKYSELKKMAKKKGIKYERTDNKDRLIELIRADN